MKVHDFQFIQPIGSDVPVPSFTNPALKYMLPIPVILKKPVTHHLLIMNWKTIVTPADLPNFSQDGMLRKQSEVKNPKWLARGFTHSASSWC